MGAKELGPTVYRCFDSAGTLLYVGCTNALGRRLAEHQRRSRWFGEVSTITVENHGTAAAQVERDAIRDERPQHNIANATVPTPTIRTRDLIVKREALRAARHHRGVSQAELARQSGVSEALIGHAETGARGLRLGTAVAIARALGVSLSEIAEVAS